MREILPVAVIIGEREIRGIDARGVGGDIEHAREVAEGGSGLAVISIAKSYDRRTVLADVSLDYLPPNLVSVVPLVRSGQLKVVDYDGKEMNAADVQARLAALPPAALAAG